MWFDRGMVWAYAFNHEEAIRCFERALKLDPEFALARWGIAYAVGPNYNKAWDAFDPTDLSTSLARARTELERAATGRASTLERDLISALHKRFPTADPDDAESLTAGHADYADAMTVLAQGYPEDVDVQALAADALLNVTAWALWDGRTGEPAPGSRVVEAKRILDAALATGAGRQHPGVLHLYIHAMEMSNTPQAALPAADLLRGLVRAHDLHFVVYSAMFEGSSHIALNAAHELAAQLTPDVLSVETPPMADWLEAFVPLRVHVLVRFGRWDDLIAEPLPSDPDLYCTTTATIHYGRGVAYAASGQVEQARAERDRFTAAYRRIPGSRYLFNNTSLDILAIAEQMLNGEIAYREGDYDTAFTYLRRAIELDDALPYDEPWGWMQPTRHAYGALLLEQGHIEEAARVYAADLGLDPTLRRSSHHPNNVWSLHGYHECLRRLGRDAEATIIGQQLELALARADVPVRASCACRLEPANPCCGGD
ncbi:tetratricopeptide repeat protein [Mycobacterium sp. CBMA295]|nr:tetratricopeptide repeat protein [Mycolicibacterium sp. CBMA 295]